MAIASAALRPGRRGIRPQADARLGSPTLGLELSECLRVKGYCVVDEALTEDVVDEVHAAIEAGAAELYQPAVAVQEGLLGLEGSNRIAKLSLKGLEEGGGSEAFRALDAALAVLANAVAPYQASLGMHCGTRSATVLHEAQEPAIEETDLTDQEANLWYRDFLTRKIMVLGFLGPDRGSLDLIPYDDESNPLELATFPRMVVLVRTDQLSFRFTTRGSAANYTATTFLLQEHILRLRSPKVDEHLTPAARELQDWIQNRIKEIKDAEGDEPDWDELETAVPRSFLMVANRTFFKRQQTAVRGIAARQPSSWETEHVAAGMSVGLDAVIDVPLTRWDHSKAYDPALDSWKKHPPRTSCRHASFYEGTDLFDAKLFTIAIAETRGMDPTQRQVLEVTYDALHRSGMKKSSLMNSSCGMYVGISSTDWTLVDKGGADFGIFGATGGAPSICAGRLSFCLGCKGASVAVDTEAASGLSSLYWAAESVEKKGKGWIQDVACGIGVHLVMAVAWWPSHSASGFLSPTGRCLTFDAAADGYVRSETTACAVVRAKPDAVVDGEQVPDDLPLEAIISGGATMNSGKTASMTAPHGPSEQAVLAEACRKSGIMPYDVDVLECHGVGKFAGDAVEVASAANALRGGTMEEMLHVCSAKTHAGNAVEASGLVSLIRGIHGIHRGVVLPNVHLRNLNPHLYLGDAPLILADEVTEHRNEAVYVGVTSHGFGGTSVHVHLFGGVDEELRRPPEPTPERLRPRLTYWPAGGGDLGVDKRPRRGFFIAGTWNGWEPERMRDEGDGCHGFTVTLGEQCFEHFQIFLDGSKDKVLYPAVAQAPKGTEVLGPEPADEVPPEAVWILDGTGGAWRAEPPNALEAVASQGAVVEAASPQWEYGASDRGQPGDRYHVLLHVAGKWRTVTWSKVEQAQVE